MAKKPEVANSALSPTRTPQDAEKTAAGGGAEEEEEEEEEGVMRNDFAIFVLFSRLKRRVLIWLTPPEPELELEPGLVSSPPEPELELEPGSVASGCFVGLQRHLFSHSTPSITCEASVRVDL